MSFCDFTISEVLPFSICLLSLSSFFSYTIVGSKWVFVWGGASYFLLFYSGISLFVAWIWAFSFVFLILLKASMLCLRARLKPWLVKFYMLQACFSWRVFGMDYLRLERRSYWQYRTLKYFLIWIKSSNISQLNLKIVILD